MKFPNDLTAVVTTADDIKMEWRFDIYGTNGKIEIVTNPWMPEQTNNKIWIHKDGKIKKINVKADKPLYVYQIDVLNNQILNPAEDFNRESMLSTLRNISVLQGWTEMYSLNQLPDSLAVA
jgi:hypothetical protein